MNIVYFSSVTNNTARFVDKLGIPSDRIPLKGSEAITVSEPFVLITPTYGSEGSGYVPPQVKKFLSNPENSSLCRGVIATGNINFAADYGRAGKIISKKFGVPLLYMLELAGTNEDVEKTIRGLKEFEDSIRQESN